MPEQQEREAERDKYVHCYTGQNQYHYGMGGARMTDALKDLAWAKELGCQSYLDIGCGRGEMLQHAINSGYRSVLGTDAVPALCDGDRAVCLMAHELDAAFGAGQFDVVSSLDVLEHLLPGDDLVLIAAASKIAAKCIFLTANNKDSIDPTTDTQLHINKREYPDWDRLIRDILEPEGWLVSWEQDKQYVSQTWRGWRE